MKSGSNRTLRSLEVFSGAGGLAVATHSAGFRHESVIEWNRDACNTLRENSGACAVLGKTRWNVIEGDIRSVDAKKFSGVDLVAGGPPCQPFSIGGKHQGKDDDRNMIPEFIRCVRDAQPRAFIMENVKGLTRESFRSYFSYAVLQLTYPELLRNTGESWNSHLSRLESIHTHGGTGGLTYNVVYRVLNAADYGVPQTRERVFIVGFRSDLNRSWHFPNPTHTKEALLHDQWVTGDYWQRHDTRKPAIPANITARLPRLQEMNLFKMEPWQTVRGAIADLPEPKDKEHPTILNHRLQPGARSYPGHTGSHIDAPSKTLKAGDHGVPGGENMILFPNGNVRYFTVREAARMQTFPDDWHFQGAWTEAMRQLGNAVPVKLAQIVAQSVATAL